MAEQLTPEQTPLRVKGGQQSATVGGQQSATVSALTQTHTWQSSARLKHYHSLQK